MKTNLGAARLHALVLAGLGLGILGCNGGSNGSGHGASTPFTLDSVSVAEGDTWQINRTIELHFSKDVDFASVNSNTIVVQQSGGLPAAGEYREGTASDGSLDPSVIVFAPRCPTLPDFSDAGLQPGGVAYVLQVVGGSGLSVVSSSGQSLESGTSVHFTTPASTDPAVLFFDTQAGPPAAVIRSSPSELDACYLEPGDSSSTNERVYFEPRSVFDPQLGADVPAGYLAPPNLYSRVEEQISALLVLDQSLDPSDSNVNADSVRLEYQEGTSWVALAHTVALLANCTPSGAQLRLTPTGILPADRVVRIVLRAGLRDLVGDPTLVDSVVGSFRVVASGGDDEWREEFSSSTGADPLSSGSAPVAPPAQWGTGWLAPAGRRTASSTGSSAARSSVRSPSP